MERNNVLIVERLAIGHSNFKKNPKTHNKKSLNYKIDKKAYTQAGFNATKQT